MKRRESWRFGSVACVVAAGVFVIGLTLQGAPPQAERGREAGRAGVAQKGGPLIRIGSGLSKFGQLPVFDPLPADYRKDDNFVSHSAGGVTAHGTSAWEPVGGMSRANTGECSIDEQCATCNACLNYGCTAGKCVLTPDLGSGTPDCDDGQYCNGEELCVDEGGEPACQPATFGPECDEGQVCDENQDACVDPCSVDADCDDAEDCTRDNCDAGTGLCWYEDICSVGRCCADDKVCQALNLPDCEATGGAWLDTNGACEQVPPSDNFNGCPKYGNGVAPQGDFIVEIGPISDLDCEALHAVGDDYETQNHATDGYMRVEFLRFGALVLDRPVNGARWQIAFHDENGIKIEDVFWPDGTNDFSGSGIRTVDFDPPLTIPTKGFVVWSVQSNFGLDGRVKLLSTTCPAGFPDKGENDCGTMWVDGAVRDLLGVCSGGDRDGEQCDRANGNGDCTGGGTCEDVPDVVVFELIGTKTSAPEGACCDGETGDCAQALPWVCTDDGGSFQGEGTLCGICDDGTTPCDQIPDDPDCDTECFPLPACVTSACCNNNTGVCREVTDPVECDDGNTETLKGFGTDCDPNCCELPESTYDGMDNCAQTPVRVINVPPLGMPPVTYTITGSNEDATFDDFPDLCDSTIYDPDDVTKDPGWWEGFTLTACAEMRIDLCCTDINGEPLRPQWSALVRNEQDGGICCDTFLQNVGVDPPIGLGRGTSGFARGNPFCDEDNLWSTWGPVPAGVYYKNIYSAPDGTSASPPGAQYQMHITVAACPIAACCVGDECSITNEYDCEQAGGYWHLGVVDCGDDCDVPDSDGLCCTGACCLGPGDCIDEIPGGEPMDEATCLATPPPAEPQYLGGVSCADDPCPVCSVEDDANCHTFDSAWFFTDDYINGGGYDIADDFVPVGDEIRQICWWGMYAIAEQFLAGCPAGTKPDEDFFEIRFFEDGGGKPGAELVGSPGPVTVTAKEDLDTAEPITQLYSVKFDTPIEVTAGQRYWVTISGAGDPDGECQWWMGTSYQGNQYCMVEGDPNREEWTQEDRAEWLIDFAFCLDTGEGGVGFDLPDPPEGTCCECDGTCSNNVAWDDCSDSYDIDSSDMVGVQLGQWDGGETCATKAITCEGGPPPGDACDDPIELVGANVSTLVSNWCATTDGAYTGQSCDNEDDESGLWINGIEHDIWVKYNAVFGGTVDIDMCADTDFDVVLEVYSNGTSTCPDTCPPDPALRVANFVNDDVLCTDFECQEPPEPSFRTFADAGECFLIRIGGERDLLNDNDDVDPMGRGRLDIISEETDCPISLAPAGDPDLNDNGFGTKNAYVTFEGSQLVPPSRESAADTHAIRVKFVTLPGFAFAEGRAMFVQEPFPVTEASATDGPTPAPTFTAARLGCDPFYADWSTYGVVDVFDAGILPGGVYEVQAIHFDCERSEPNYSLPLTVVTSAIGDLAGNTCTLVTCNPPQGVVDFTDINAVVEKFKNTPGAPRKARTDLLNGTVSLPYPDRKVDFVDIAQGVDAFRGAPLPPVGPPADDPCAP